MSWFREYSRKVLGPYLPILNVEKATKFVAIMRITYFFSASTLFMLLVYRLNVAKKKQQEMEQLESGKPVIVDHSPGHEVFRTKGAEYGIIYDFSPSTGLKRSEYNREQYYNQIEREALERAKEAQRKAIEEGRQLPPDAIKLV